MNVVYFDGHCNLCNRFVDYLIQRDKTHKLRFAPLQGTTSAQRVPQERRERLGTIVYEREGKFHIRSTAAILILSELGGIYPLAKILLVIPKFLRDLVYRYIAKNRYLWFGKRDTCRLPAPAEKLQFLP